MNKITFRCKRSGNTVSFFNEPDIEGLRKHEGYEEVKNEEVKETSQAPKEVLTIKRRGRPPAVPDFLSGVSNGNV